MFLLAVLKEMDVQEQKAYAIHVLDEMGLNQIAEWVKILPENRWQELFVYHWPILAKKCGIRD